MVKTKYSAITPWTSLVVLDIEVNQRPMNLFSIPLCTFYSSFTVLQLTTDYGIDCQLETSIPITFSHSCCSSASPGNLSNMVALLFLGNICLDICENSVMSIIKIVYFQLSLSSSL
ncbi:hypothetical protein J6590_056431 [Homalodisca vitripennis]|nr:hypothetical protein J6590_056431 [Homalodisca vitripennis]